MGYRYKIFFGKVRFVSRYILLMNRQNYAHLVKTIFSEVLTREKQPLTATTDNVFNLEISLFCHEEFIF
jgi:hypothetical protein